MRPPLASGMELKIPGTRTPGGARPGTWEAFLLAERSGADRYTAAMAFVCAALLVVHVLHRVEGTQLGFVPFAAVVLSAIYGGLGPALLAAAACAVSVDYLFAAPVMEVFDSAASWLRVAAYASVGFLIANIVSSLGQAYRALHAQHRRTQAEKRARENLLCIVAHDLRSPLTGVLLGLEHARSELAEGAAPGQVVRVLDGTHRSAARMRRLVEDLLDAAKIEKGRFAVRPGMHRIYQILEDALVSLHPAAHDKGVRLLATLPPEDAFIRCDAERIQQALINLAGNAIKFSPHGAAVELRVQLDEAWLRIDVRDCGPGIDARHLPHLFDQYWQAPDAAHLGTGLGLFIVRSVVEAHGGRVGVVSAVGCGSIFSVWLPRVV